MALAFLFTNNQENGKGNQMIWTEPFEGILKVPCNQVTVYWYVLLLVDKINNTLFGKTVNFTLGINILITSKNKM